MSTPGNRPRPRERVVLATRRGARPVRVRGRVEVQEQTDVGDALIRGLMRAQLGLALRLGGMTVVVLCVIPLVLALVPAAADAQLLGVRVIWLILGVGVYPVLFGVCRRYNRLAERTETEFGDLVDQ